MNQPLVSPSAFFYGLPVGFAFSFALGPIFFSLIKASLEHGFRAAVYIAVGVILADLALLVLAYGGLDMFLPREHDATVSFWVQIFGGGLLIGLGLFSLLKKGENTEGVALVDKTLFWKNIAQGFFFNILNPANFMEWVGTVGLLKTKYHFETYENVSFFSGALLAVFLTELGVAYFASRLRRHLNPRLIRFINILSGLVFIGFGIFLLVLATAT